MSDALEPIRVGVIGLGGFGRLHALTLAALAETQLVAMVGNRQPSVDALREELPDVPGWTELDRAIGESDAQAWVVASSTASHVPITRTLLEAGLPVLLEKPIAETLDEARSLEPLVAEDSRNLMLGHILLFNSEFLAVREEVARRGAVFFMDAIRHRPIALAEKFPGETPFQLTMVHDLYCALALMGQVDPVSIGAQVHRTASGEVDMALAQLQWEDGRLARFAAGYVTPPGMPADGFDRLEVCGPGWMARLQPNPRPIEVWGQRADWPMGLELRAGEDGPTGMLAEELRCFSRVARGQHPPPVGATFQDALRVQRWIDQMIALIK